MLVGLTCILANGLWIIEMYDILSVYPKEAYGYLYLGIGLVVIAFLIIQFKRKTSSSNEMVHTFRNEKDNRVYIDKIWANKEKLGDKAVGVLLITLVIIAFFDLGMAISLLLPILVVGSIIVGFIFIMSSYGNDKGDEPKSRIMRMIDYRTHPFSLPLILFVLIVVSFLLSKQFGFTLSLATGGNPRYVIGLPTSMYLEATLVFVCGFFYIIHNGDFLGIHQEKQGGYKLVAIHFLVLIFSGSTLLIWLGTLIEALITW